jgi:hypothetical protein
VSGITGSFSLTFGSPIPLLPPIFSHRVVA